MSKKNTIILSYKEKRNILFLKNYQNNKKFHKLCLLSHFDINNKIEEYVVYMIKELYKLKFDIVFVTTTENMKIVELNKISSYVKIAIIKKNVGYDFISWKTALYAIGEYKHYEQILHINDSIFFPLFNPKIMFDKMKTEKVDFWGLSDSYRIQYHIQSFFWVFNKKLLRSCFYNNFWNNCTALGDKGKIIREYEVGFTSLLQKNNFKISAYNKVESIYNFVRNKFENLLPIDQYSSFYTFWDIVIDNFKAPYLKKNILIENSSSYNVGAIPWEYILKSTTKYDTGLIRNYLKSIAQLDSKVKFAEFNINTLIFVDFINFLKSKKGIVIYGYSQIGILIHSILNDNVIDIVDKNYLQINKLNHSRIIKNPDVLKEIQYDCIAICSFGRETDILHTCRTLEVEESNILTYPLDKNVDIMKFSNNLTKLLDTIEAIDIENQKKNLTIQIYRTKNVLVDYLKLYSALKKLNTIQFIDSQLTSNSNEIIFQVKNNIDKTISDVYFLPS
jgi:hypothetical protein